MKALNISPSDHRPEFYKVKVCELVQYAAEDMFRGSNQ